MDAAPIDPSPERAELTTEAPPVPATPSSFAPMFAAAAWIVPGLGHLLLRRWVRAAAFFIAVAGLAFVGYTMRGEVFAVRSEDSFGTLGFLADIGSGAFYFLSRIFESSGADLSRSAGDYGTRLIAAAGIVNIVAIIDAYEIAGRRRG
ncbi:MAG TPA: DUF6677 family protein [Candidatus Acidoferrum sp.]|jgi:hypothetical protein|nr:DUF6677 family protein [Candidatus Acidoferrum sp.]